MMTGLSLRFPSTGTIRFNKVTILILAVIAIVFIVYLHSGRNPIIQEESIRKQNRYRFDTVVEIKDFPEVNLNGIPYLRFYNNSKPPYQKDILHECVPLKTPKGPTKICIYKPDDDRYVSKILKEHGTYEEGNLGQLGEVLTQQPDLVFVDIGCNIGTFSVYAAKFGVPVICVDPLASNLQLFNETVHRVGIQERVFLLWNAISDIHENLTLIQGQGHNFGSTGTRKQDDPMTANKVVNYTVPSITLNDLVPLLKGRKIFMKMDIESYEMKALMASQEFFNSVNVRYIMMEVVSYIHSRQKDIVWIEEYLRKCGMAPSKDAFERDSLSGIQYHEWPAEVYWVKSRYR